jgi:hypothetical protein
MKSSVLIRKARIRRLMQPHLAVLLTSTGWCMLHITTHHSNIIISWLLVHRCIKISCLELWHSHRPCCTHHHRRWAQCPAPATIIVKLVTSFETVLHQGILLLLVCEATATNHLRVQQRSLLSRYWNNKLRPLERRPPNFIRFNGINIQKMKPHVNV